ncbi:Hypothetical protein CAP_2279 [Chondromyces apiculatus DSM 436]|uniref:Uncharacterized protein n=1 Tax=Chondromyces apiculatus DSM 436 TaxID=1192034 RepID=A0A017TA52_9BACT|nr:Hypothetical protein CAP_2279 [Chondromyces apiculatus DSM 436]
MRHCPRAGVPSRARRSPARAPAGRVPAFGDAGRVLPLGLGVDRWMQRAGALPHPERRVGLAWRIAACSVQALPGGEPLP